MLDYISNETFRRCIQRGLNKGKATNALARALFFGKHGELRESALQDQLQRSRNQAGSNLILGYKTSKIQLSNKTIEWLR